MIEKETIKIENMIYEIRGKQVMLDNIQQNYTNVPMAPKQSISQLKDIAKDFLKDLCFN